MSETPVGVPTCYRHPGRETYIRCQRCDRPICPDCMQEASVGFQCPDCVAEGRRTVRQAKGAYGGRPSANPGATSLVLIVVNAAIWIAITIAGGSGSRLVELLALRARGLCRAGDGYYLTSEQVCAADDAARWVYGVSDGAYWQLLTSMFTHVQPLHLGFNMLAIWVLGPQLESILGRVRYLALYLLSGLTASVAVYWLSAEYSSTVGASGSVFGLLGALLVVGLKRGDYVQGLLLWLGINVVITFAVPNVSWQGHLGGLAGGALIAAILVFAPRERRTTLQVAGLAVLAVLLVAATVARTLVLGGS
ncbi:rhomboid family intramembrane serine protease [Nocardioides sp. SYSU DS0651]|uniref:rhomboid family intramembrane serine protease n=1 Tax=Nocardioides sp. SYSU DS0651 TaxID=3415955 RepID=UPI003F4BB88B